MYEFVKANIQGTRIYKMTEMVNKKFGLNITEKQMRSYLRNHKLKNGLYYSTENKRQFSIFTEEQRQFILENYIGIGNQALTDLINERFKTSFTYTQIKRYKNNHHLNSGLDNHFEKGHIPPNKGKKMSAEQYEKCKATMFKKGNIPHNTCPVGTERIESKNHYLKIKIAEPNKWILKHVYIWENFHGKNVPKGCCITFLDGNNRNFDINNLACITQDENARLNQNNLRSEFAEVTQANINIVKLNKTIRDFKKKKENKNNE